MIDKEKLARIQAGEEFKRQPTLTAGMSEGDLLRLRAEIDAQLPQSLADLKLEQELLRQYGRVKALQEDVLEDGDVPANQKAQVAAQVAATLQHLVKMQSEWHTSERLKEIEGRLIRALEKVPAEYLEEFFKWYEGEDA